MCDTDTDRLNEALKKIVILVSNLATLREASGKKLDTLRKSLTEVTAERDEIITIAHNRGIKDELEIEDLKAERDRLRATIVDAIESIESGNGHEVERDLKIALEAK